MRAPTRLSVTATGGTIGTAWAALLYVDEGAGGTYTPLWYIDFGEAKEATVGNDFKVNFNANGISRHTVT